jgi:FOG: FHA domain
VDYCIKDNSAVSRSHADILRKENGYVIVDNNSLNHTFVNGIQLVPQDQMLLADGAVVMLADEEFEFKEKGV